MRGVCAPQAAFLPPLRPGLKDQRTNGVPRAGRGRGDPGGRRDEGSESRRRMGPRLTFVLCHEPLERRPCHRLGNPVPSGLRARILPPDDAVASGSPLGRRSPSGLRGARAQ